MSGHLRTERGPRAVLALALLLGLLAALTVTLQASAKEFQAAAPRRNVLVLNSYHKAQWSDSILKGIESYLKADDGIDLFIEYMDTKRIDTREYLDLLAAIYGLKYAPIHLDLIITSDDNAFHFALKWQQELFHDAPIVFCGVNRFEEQMLEGHPNVTGVVERGDFADTLATATKMRPESDTVYVICDNTKTGQINRARFEQVVSTQFPGLHAKFLQDLSLSDLESRLKKLPSQSFGFFISFWQDIEGTIVSPDQLEVLFRSSAVPIFGRSEWMIGKGLAGGKCVSGFLQGSTAARLGKRILKGESPAALSVITKSPNQFMFDYQVLAHYSIAPSTIPAGSIIINQPAESLSVSKTTLILITAAILVLLLLVLFLGLNIVSRRRAQAALAEKETKYRELVESANSIIMRIDDEGRVILFNDFAQSFFGYDESEILGKNVIGTLFEETEAGGADVAELIRSAYQNIDYRRNLVLESVLPNDRRVWIAWTFKAMVMPDGSREVLCVGNDITDRKRAEEALLKSEERFRELAELLPETIFEMDVSGKLTFVNQKAYEHFQATAEEVEAGLNAFDLLVPEDRQRARFNASRVLDGEVIGINEYRALRKDRSVFPVLVHTSRIVREEQTAGLRGFVIDITETKKLEQQLLQAQKMEAIGTLAGGIAHDFNNLLQVIQGYSELFLMKAKKGQHGHHELSAINRAARRAADLTQQLLAFSRNVESRLSPCDLNQVVEQTRALLDRTIPKMIRIDLRLSDDMEEVLADATQLEQVLMNLAINARDAMPEGGTLTIETARAPVPEHLLHQQPIRGADGFIRLQISDTGSGMDAETMQHIFDPFFTTKEVGKGTGLGLAMAFGIVKNHRGYLDCTSEPNRGTTFTIYLPTISEDSNGRADGESTALLTGVETILLVDDEDHIRDLGKKLLGGLGYRVITAEDGAQALRTYRESAADIDLVLLDLIMPGMGGFQCLEQLMAINPSVKAIIVSGHHSHDLTGIPSHLGPRRFISKPFQIRDLLVAIRAELDTASR